VKHVKKQSAKVRPRPMRAAHLRAWVMAFAVLAGSGLGIASLSSPASAYPSATVSFQGHGYGHGHGMGQWGALGYALAGTPYTSILTNYYGGTAVSPLTPSLASHPVSVSLTENAGNSVIVTSASGFTVSYDNGSGSIAVPAGSGIEMVPNGSTWDLYLGGGCAGPWPSTPTTSSAAVPSAQPSVTPALGDPNTAAEVLQLCQAGGNLSLRGTIQAIYNSLGQSRTVNILPLESYVSDVVPNESPAGWGSIGGAGPQGQAWGFQELEAQAVAVRSYAMASPMSYGGYADTCDLTCQTYRGILHESAVTNLAASATAGQVMETPGGVIAATQYSSSTGGYTNPGGFPGVVDVGDSVCVPGACNPNHTWTASVAVSTIDAAWPQLGVLQSISITGRNGLGDFGGRVTQMTLNGSNQNVSLTGDAFASAVGLKSDWFTTTTTLSGPAIGLATTRDGQGYWVADSNGGVFGFGDAAFQGAADSLALARPMVGIARTPDSGGYWMVATDGGVFSYGDASFHGSTGNIALNKPIVGMTPTPSGAGYWLVASDGGVFAFGDATFYGSTGNIHLNQPVVGMAATPDGRGYWLVASDGGVFAFGDATFYGSTGNIHLNKPVVGMTAAPGGGGYWMVASDGGIFAFGNAVFRGSTGNIVLNKPIVGMATTPSGAGYWMVASDGGIFNYGDAGFFGSAAS
jgi:SpoIID/LytB domain protein